MPSSGLGMTVLYWSANLRKAQPGKAAKQRADMSWRTRNTCTCCHACQSPRDRQRSRSPQTLTAVADGHLVVDDPVWTSQCVCVCVCVCACVCVCRERERMRTREREREYIYIYNITLYIYIYIHTYIHITCIHIYQYIHTHTKHTHTYVPR